jgi:hypothetical protein
VALVALGEGFHVAEGAAPGQEVQAFNPWLAQGWFQGGVGDQRVGVGRPLAQARRGVALRVEVDQKGVGT